MKTSYRKSATIAALIAAIGSAQPAHAQLAVVCANCSSEWTQLANNAELVAQVANEAKQLQQEIQQYELSGRLGHHAEGLRPAGEHGSPALLEADAAAQAAA